MRPIAAAAFAALLLSACARAPLAPEPLPLDRYNCARCGMMISSIEDAAEWVRRGEETRFYDDLGCAASDASRVPAGGRFFVRADRGTGWLSAEKGYFALSAGVRTPMGFGFVAFSNGAEARASDSHGRSLRWPDVVRSVRPPAPGGVR